MARYVDHFSFDISAFKDWLKRTKLLVADALYLTPPRYPTHTTFITYYIRQRRRYFNPRGGNDYRR